MLEERVLAPIVAGTLLVGVAAVAWSTRRHRRIGPLVLTLAGSVGVAGGRLLWSSRPLLYAGAVLLVGASLWNLWLKRSSPPRSQSSARTAS